jgi:hypothetical protein
MTKPTPMERISAYHAAQDYGEAKRKEKLAAIFKPSDRMERLIEMRVKDPAVLDSFGQATRIELGHYKQQRAAVAYDPGDDAA